MRGVGMGLEVRGAAGRIARFPVIGPLLHPLE